MKVAFAVSFIALVSLSAAAQDPLPQEEDKLLAFAVECANKDLHADADRAFRAFIGRFPKSEHLESAMAQLANLHHETLHHPEEARRWYLRLCEAFPKSEALWSWRYEIGETYAEQKEVDRALAEFRKVALESNDAGLRGMATQKYWKLQGKDLSLQVNRTYSLGQQPVVIVKRGEVRDLTYRIYRIDYAAFLPRLRDLDSDGFAAIASALGPGARTLLKEWSEIHDVPIKDGGTEDEIKIPATEAGVYILVAEHQGLSIEAVVVVGRYGLITKAAAGKLVCFVQERATTRPVPGATINVLGDERPFLGETDGQGLFVTAGFKGGLIVGTKDGEIFLANAGWTDPGRDEFEDRIYIATDRPVYRPGHTVRFRIVHREERGRDLSFKPGAKFVVWIADPRDNRIHLETVALNEFGSAEGSFTLGDTPLLGVYQVRVRPEPKTPEELQSLFTNWYFSRPMGNFRVDEYRKPEFKVLVSYASPSAVQGDTLEATVKAEYYFGGPVEDAEVRYSIKAARTGSWYWGWGYFYDWYASDPDAFEEHPLVFGRDYLGDSLANGEGRTDKDGRLAVKVPTEKTDSDVTYTVVAEVTDLSRRQVVGLGSCPVARAQFSLALQTGKYVYAPGERIALKVRAYAPEQKPVAGQKVTVKARDRRWDAEGEADDKLLYEASSITDELGNAEFSVTPNIKSGFLVFTAEATDSKGNSTSTEEWAWLVSSGEWVDLVNVEGLEIVPDKKSYEPGETAKILIQSSVKNLTLLLTLEGAELYHRQVVTLKGHTRMVEIPLDHPGLAPNVLVMVCALKGDDILQGTKRLVVNPARKFINVEIKPDHDEYRPRQKARYDIRTTDADGRPVAAEVAVGIVDEAIYAIQDEYEPDIRKYFVSSQKNDVVTSMSLYPWNYGGRGRGGPLTGATFAMAGEEAKESFDSVLAPTEVRSKFSDTMLWKIVRTDAQGRAAVEVDIPDNLTTWRATARAITADSRFGQERRAVVSRKNVIVRVETPRFLTQNDVSTLSAVVHNYLPAEKEFRIEFAAQGVESKGEAVQVVRIPAGGQKRIDWTAVARDPGEARVTVKALGVDESDAMEVTLPVRPHGSPKWDSRAGLVEARTIEKVMVPADAIADSAELLVAVSPVHASMVLDALDSLAGYPYGCTEQTMSKFLPSVIVAGTLRKLGVSKPALEKELPKMISKGLQRLYSFQHEDGGWGWWTYDKTNPWMTGYVLSGLAMAREAGVEVAENSWTQALASARALLAQTNDDPNLQAYLVYAISLAGDLEEGDLLARDRLDSRLGDLKPCAQALLALAFHRSGKDPQPVLNALAKSIHDTGKAAIIEKAAGWGWLDDNVEAAAAALRAYLAIDPKNPVVPKLVHGLGLKRRGPWWRSTRQTAMAVYALSDYLERTGELNPDLTVSLTINGRNVYSEHITKENWARFDGVRRFKAADLRPGENDIVIEKAGSGTPTYTIGLEYLAKGEDMAASKGRLTILREYSRIVRKGEERMLVPLPPGATVTSGEEIEVTLGFTTDDDHEWLMVEDPLPAGFEPVREYWGWWGWSWDYWYSSKEFHDDRVSISMSELRAGTHTVSYTMRAETPGDYHALPARAFNMYFPEIGANSAESRIKVVEKK